MRFEDYECLRFARQGRVLTVSLHRPEQLYRLVDQVGAEVEQRPAGLAGRGALPPARLDRRPPG